MTIISSGGGVFEIKVNGKLLFSKAELGRFPEEGEAENLIKEAI
jgi:selenoprotein W-related protein